ncbi:MAG: NAD(P)-dependent glycerol-3-phosphate dehydrogenase [Myxococcales bacterium]|nr:NAD(P)-dependent glycerol-3-phosphate dehydrogenase [Myxococcales bacterium]MCB9668992.1 NAD(P)-dependent glycerol-3-phosphate dehydrogenase [Alphaproteobacteria bacterium]MCB9691319.1 NAD(P)-dependent glycerol-3-phosphate dehydrogenase [Alphaproteobacteria bacterium]
MRCTVLGAGSWGTALAVQLARNGHDTLIWDRNPGRCAVMNSEHRNPRYLKTVELPHNLRAEPDLAVATAHASLLVPVVPSHALREVMEQALPSLAPSAQICCATKGIEDGTLETMHELLVQVTGTPERISMLYGPSFALEVARGLPTAVVIAGPDRTAQIASEAFHDERFRCYHTEDTVGVCIGGSLKNVMAIACGVSDGVGLGSNARAGIITRGLAEITRLAVARGANPLTLAGLAGMGDLVLTCTGDLSRNRRVGLALGQGRTLEDILEELGEVAEGVITAKTARDLAHATGVEMPITEEIHALLYDGKPARAALESLMGRRRRAERDH